MGYVGETRKEKTTTNSQTNGNRHLTSDDRHQTSAEKRREKNKSELRICHPEFISGSGMRC